MSGKPLMHGEPDAWKPARPVRREGWRDLALKGVVALHPYSTFGFRARARRGLDGDRHGRDDRRRSPWTRSTCGGRRGRSFLTREEWAKPRG